MSTHKHFDKICCVVLALTLLLTVIFMNAEFFGIQKAPIVMGYEKALFDSSKVHTIDIIMDNWDEFTANARNEEYYSCTVVIDNESYKNVAIRGKGNTSLSSVTNDRYSYKIEFDHYDSTNTYHGLDKLCLNNIIQDNTYMKDYLTYTMMNDMGVAAPLCSFVYITVNGEDWGLYLAVEGVEESFLQRNYGNDYGELYKPDSLDMGGGRGNGNKFDMDEFMQDFNPTDNKAENDTGTENPETTPEEPDTGIPEEPEINQGEAIPDFNPGELLEGQLPDFGTLPDFNGENPFGGQIPDIGSLPDFNSENPFGGQIPDIGSLPDFNGGNSFGSLSAVTSPTISNTTLNNSQNPMTPPDFGGENPFSGGIPDGMEMPDFGDMGGFGGMSSSDVKLQYTDDNFDSYSNIFENAKTDITDEDKTRLIEALEKLSNGEDLGSTVDIESVIRYFVVHNFVVNSDSYTGSMIHNYYLYEKDGKMQMIPWDYNLAFGTFMSMGSATSSVNDPIDTPLSVSGSGDRPMIDWIFSNEEYTELYHQIFAEFIELYFNSGYFTDLIDNVEAMIAPYVKKDPTKFCTYEEFETGVATLKEFCLLRAESVKGQLNGTIGSTSSSQEADTLIDASGLDTASMGTMGGGMNFPGENMQNPQNDSDSNGSRPQRPDNFQEGSMPDFGNNAPPQMPGEDFPFREGAEIGPQSRTTASSLLMTGICVSVLLFGIIFALIFKRRKR